MVIHVEASQDYLSVFRLGHIECSVDAITVDWHDYKNILRRWTHVKVFTEEVDDFGYCIAIAAANQPII